MEVQRGISNNPIRNQFTEQTNDLLLLKHFYELYGTCQRPDTDKGTKNIKAKKKNSIHNCNKENQNNSVLINHEEKYGIKR